MGQLIEQARLNKLDDALNDAITTVGGDPTSASSLMDYPDIISKQLTADPRGIDGRIVGDETITVKDTATGYALSAIGTANAKLVNDIKISDTKQISKGETVQDVFTYLFTTVLPNMNSASDKNKTEVYQEFENIKNSLKTMDIDINVIVSSVEGLDNYSVNDLPFVKCDLQPLTYYLRIRKTNNQEAIYVSLEKLTQIKGHVVKSDLTGKHIYSINDKPFMKDGLKADSYYLLLSVGEFTKPTYIDLTGLYLDVKDGTISPDKLDGPTKETIEKVPVIHEEIKKQQEYITIVEKLIEETLTEEEANELVWKIFK